MLDQADLDRIADHVERWYVKGRPRLDALLETIHRMAGELPSGSEERDLFRRLAERVERWYTNGGHPMRRITEELRNGRPEAE